MELIRQLRHTLPQLPAGLKGGLVRRPDRGCAVVVPRRGALDHHAVDQECLVEGHDRRLRAGVGAAGAAEGAPRNPLQLTVVLD